MQTKKFVLLDIDYVTRNGEAVIRLFGKVIGESDQNHIIVLDKSFRPYIYIIPSNTSDIGACTRDLSELGLFGVEKVFRNDMGESKGVLKITLKHPRNIPKLRDKIRNLASVKEVREYDIPFYRRYLIDKGLSPMNVVQVEGKVLSAKSSTCVFQLENPPTTLDYSLPKLSFLSFDIEVYSPHGMPQSDRDPIIMISFSSNQGFQKVFSTKNSALDFVEVVADEKELLGKFAETIQFIDPDVLLGYNSDAFDLPYIKDRATRLGVPLKIGIDGSQPKSMKIGFNNAPMIRGRIHVDLYPNIRRYLQINRHTLEYVYKELFGAEKLDIPGDEIHNYWDEGGDKLKQLFMYSLDDAVSVTRIGEKMLPLSIELTRIVGQPLFEVARMASGRHVEWYLIKKSFQYGNLVPDKAPKSELSRRKAIHTVGGYVKEPVNGLHEEIVYFDFRSLYPSIIISKNISPDSLTDNNGKDCHITPEYGHRFLKEPAGFIPLAIGRILQDRIRIKSMMKESEDNRERQVLNVQQQALKRMANTIYGLYNHNTFRWYSLECSEAITAWGRDFLKKTMEDARTHGFEPVYADTDGFFATYKRHDE